jgi:hydrogenase expression/formation protein HypD
MGAREWRFVPENYRIPTAIAGFGNESLLAAFYSTLNQFIEHTARLDNCYPELVKEEGNPSAQRWLQKVMSVQDANWRGIGTIPQSGFSLNPEYASHNARLHFPSYADESRKRAGEMPPGCDCASVVLGKLYPNQCRLYGTACTPRKPVGPCMVSDEGACRIWWAGGTRNEPHAANQKQA